MGWPLSQDYNEAVQSPAISFEDPQLRQGEATANPLGIPLPRSGNFADVYEFTCPGGARFAVKCFTREVPGLRERYAEVSRHLQMVRLRFTVEFDFLQRGIQVRGHWYPILKMQWVEGQALNDFVRAYADKPAMLDALLRIWVRMAERLREARVAHGDVQHGNLLLIPKDAGSLAVRLIDYDGMFVPALAGKKSGEVGHPNFQHPQRLREATYGPDVDRFPLLLVATALCCLKTGGKALWEKYDSGDNLLFRESDLQAPTKSPLFYELLKTPDPQARALVGHVLDARRAGPESAPLLEQVLPEQPVPLKSSAGVSKRGVRQPQAVEEPRAEEAQVSEGPRAAVGLWVLGGLVLMAAAVAVGVWNFAPPLRPQTAPQHDIPTAVAMHEGPGSSSGEQEAAPAEQSLPVPPRTEPVPLTRKAPATTKTEPIQSVKTPPTQLPPEQTAPPATRPAPLRPSVPPPAKPAPKEPPKEAAQPPGRPPERMAQKPPESPKPPSPKKAQAEPPALPDEAAVAAAIHKVREEFKDQYAHQATAAARLALAQQLLQGARQCLDDPVKRLALYREARDAAVSGDAFGLGLEIAAEMAQNYPLAPRVAQVEALLQAGKTRFLPASAKAFIEAALPLIKEAWEADDYETLAPLIPLAQRALTAAQDANLSRSAEPFVGRFDLVRKSYEAVKPALRKRTEKPEDPAACQAVGAFLCFVKQDWEKGLPLLSEAEDKGLAAAADKDLKAPEEAAAQVAVGDAWTEEARKHPEYHLAMHKRAYLWYDRALPQLSEKEKDRVEKYVVEGARNSPQVREHWAAVDISRPGIVVAGDAYLRLIAGRGFLQLRKAVAGPVEISVKCRVARGAPRLGLLQGGVGLMLWDNTSKRAGASRPRRPGVNAMSSSLPFEFSAHTWYTLTWRLTEEGIEGSINDRTIYRDITKYNLTRPLIYQVAPRDIDVEIQEITVKAE